MIEDHLEYLLTSSMGSEGVVLLALSNRCPHCYCLCTRAFEDAEAALVGQGYVRNTKGQGETNIAVKRLKHTVRTSAAMGQISPFHYKSNNGNSVTCSSSFLFCVSNNV